MTWEDRAACRHTHTHTHARTHTSSRLQLLSSDLPHPPIESETACLFFFESALLFPFLCSPSFLALWSTPPLVTHAQIHHTHAHTNTPASDVAAGGGQTHVALRKETEGNVKDGGKTKLRGGETERWRKGRRGRSREGEMKNAVRREGRLPLVPFWKIPKRTARVWQSRWEAEDIPPSPPPPPPLPPCAPACTLSSCSHYSVSVCARLLFHLRSFVCPCVCVKGLFHACVIFIRPFLRSVIRNMSACIYALGMVFLLLVCLCVCECVCVCLCVLDAMSASALVRLQRSSGRAQNFVLFSVGQQLTDTHESARGGAGRAERWRSDGEKRLLKSAARLLCGPSGSRWPGLSDHSEMTAVSLVKPRTLHHVLFLKGQYVRYVKDIYVSCGRCSPASPGPVLSPNTTLYCKRWRFVASDSCFLIDPPLLIELLANSSWPSMPKMAAASCV